MQTETQQSINLMPLLTMGRQFLKTSKFWERNDERSDESEWGQQHFTLFRSHGLKKLGKRNVRLAVFRSMCRVYAYNCCSSRGTEDLCTVWRTRRKRSSLLDFLYFLFCKYVARMESTINAKLPCVACFLRVATCLAKTPLLSGGRGWKRLLLQHIPITEIMWLKLYACVFEVCFGLVVIWNAGAILPSKMLFGTTLQLIC